MLARSEEMEKSFEALEKRITALENQIKLQSEAGGGEEIPKKYPKRIMRLSELEKLGYTKEYLMKQYRIRGQKFAKKQDPTRRNSPIIFDTELFERQQQRQQELENRQIRRG